MRFLAVESESEVEVAFHGLDEGICANSQHMNDFLVVNRRSLEQLHSCWRAFFGARCSLFVSAIYWKVRCTGSEQ